MNDRSRTDPAAPAMTERKRIRLSTPAVVALCLVCVLLSSLLTWGIALKAVRESGPEASPDDIRVYPEATESTAPESPVALPKLDSLLSEEADGDAKTPSEIYYENLPSVVGITATGVTSNIFGQTTATASSGSGFVIREDGYILTNSHVIEGASSFTVSFYDGTTYPAKLIGFENEISDLAVLKIDAAGLRPVTLASSDQMAVGQDVVVIGNPLGELTFSLTKGVVSALGRQINADGNPITMFQIDAAVNSGNSGGPAFDSLGRVVGVVTAKYASEKIEGLGFCIPSTDAADIASDLIEYGYVKGRATLGLACRDAAELYNRYYLYYGSRVSQIRNLLSRGVYVAAVTEGSAADRAGLEPDCYITALNGSEISDCAALRSALSSLKPGEEITLRFYRDGVYADLTLTLDEYSPLNGVKVSAGDLLL